VRDGGRDDAAEHERAAVHHSLERLVTSPTQQLAERVVQRLLAERLVTPEDAARLQSKLTDGKLRPEDWRVVLEHAGDVATRDAGQVS